MDTETLVDGQLQEGEKLLQTLKTSGFPLTAACWVLTTIDGRWYFYIASPVVETEGLAAALGKVYAELNKRPRRWLDRSEIRLIESTHPIAADAVTYGSDAVGTYFQGRKLGNLIVDEAYLYPTDF